MRSWSTLLAVTATVVATSSRVSAGADVEPRIQVRGSTAAVVRAFAAGRPPLEVSVVDSALVLRGPPEPVARASACVALLEAPPRTGRPVGTTASSS